MTGARSQTVMNTMSSVPQPDAGPELSALALAPAWYGKLPGLGDFASRRLRPDQVDFWDDWLATGMQRLREQDPSGWLDRYLAAPSWRFLLMPGVLGQAPSAGVLMPSVDRVGRYFPLLLLLELAEAPAAPQQMQSLWHWLGRLDELAGDALHEDWTAERLEQELSAMARPQMGGAALAAAPEASAELQLLPALPTARLLTLGGGLDAATRLGVEAQALWNQQARGRSYWLAQPTGQAPQLLVAQGLPDSAADLMGALSSA